MKKLFSALVLSLISTSAFSAQCLNGKNWDCKNARNNDRAAQYMLDNSGNFYRYFQNGQTCQITSNVKDFKISQHPSDRAVAYYESNGTLYVVHNQGTSYTGNCPPVSKKAIMQNVKEWKIVSNTNSTIVNAALDSQGNFNAWDDNNVVYKDTNITDFEMNSCFGSAGKSFSSYALFTLSRFGDVTKVKTSGSFFVSDASKTERGNWTRLSQWKNDKGGICK